MQKRLDFLVYQGYLKKVVVRLMLLSSGGAKKFLPGESGIYKGKDMMVITDKHCLTIRDANIVLAVIIWMGILSIPGCSFGNYARLKVSRDVTQAFETYHVFPGYRYYYLKQENAPFAIVALRDDYTISSMDWYEFDAASGRLAPMVDFAKQVAMEYYYPIGANILSPQGDLIGYWYSGLRIRGIEVDRETKRISIYTNTPWLDEEDRGF